MAGLKIMVDGATQGQVWCSSPPFCSHNPLTFPLSLPPFLASSHRHYNMFSYVTVELPALLRTHFSSCLLPNSQSICGHSMGGHGALICAIKSFLASSSPSGIKYASVSCFAPIAHPTSCQWGQKAFSGYLDSEDGKEEKWAAWDATLLMETHGPFPFPILIDQGTADKFLEEQLKPGALEAACEKKGQNAKIRMREGYDHSYFFISTFLSEHIDFHADALGL